MKVIADVLAVKYPQFNTITQDTFVSDALYQMCCENVDFLIVYNSEKFVGIITDHDIASKVLFDDRPLNKICVKEFMTQCLPIAESQNTIGYCLQLIERYNARFAAIFDDFEFKGIVSLNDLMRYSLENKLSVTDDGGLQSQTYPWNY